jgi:predicted metal-dependent HD superfamily phosphohydrolase
MTELPDRTDLFPAGGRCNLLASDETSPAAWTQVWAELGVRRAPRDTYEELIRRYCEPHRAYHNRQHLAECLHVRRRVNAPCQTPAEVDLALWFHDAIYDPLRSDNELRSAQWLDDVARDNGLDEETRRRLYELVMVTQHDGAPATADEAVLVDTDLAILGASSERFEEYDQQIRLEYQYVPLPVYRQKRRQVLERFLTRKRIYTTPSYFETFEQQARANLVRAIPRLS